MNNRTKKKAAVSAFICMEAAFLYASLFPCIKTERNNNNKIRFKFEICKKERKMSKKYKIIITGKEKLAILVIIFSKLSKFCIMVQFMNTLFRANVTPCLSIVIIYWIYCNWVAGKFELDYINAIERIIYFKLVSRIDQEDYEEYVSKHKEYFKT